ncbi:MAG: glycine cleavage system protein H, partial [Acidobacteriota bacterium]
PYGGGWMIKVKLSKASEIDALLNASEYEDFVESQKDE